MSVRVLCMELHITYTVKTQFALHLKLLQQCSSAPWHFHTLSNPSQGGPSTRKIAAGALLS